MKPKPLDSHSRHDSEVLYTLSRRELGSGYIVSLGVRRVPISGSRPGIIHLNQLP